jgi:hypothetical protein
VQLLLGVSRELTMIVESGYLYVFFFNSGQEKNSKYGEMEGNMRKLVNILRNSTH